MAARYRLNEVQKLKGRDIFLDANILIYLFWPTGKHYFEQNYARVFHSLLKQKNKLYVDFLVLSEVINRVIRIEHAKTELKFKEFRDSQKGQETLSDIYLLVKDDILRKFSVAGKVFDKEGIESNLVVDELDFVDKAILSLCQEHNFVLLTNDRDFKNSNVEILTGNPSILR